MTWALCDISLGQSCTSQTVSIVQAILKAFTALSCLFLPPTLGPDNMVIMHGQQLLNAAAMIGPTSDLKDLLRVTINPMDTLLIQDWFVPGFPWTEETRPEFLHSGFWIKSAFLGVVVSIMKFLFGYAVLMVFATNITAATFKVEKKWVRRTSEFLHKFAFVSYPLWILFDALFFGLLAICVEINIMKTSKSSTLEIVSLVGAILIQALLTGLMLFFLYLSIWHKFGRTTEKHPDFTVLQSGLKTHRWWVGIMFYSHFLAIWVIIALCVILSSLVSPKILLGILLVAQSVCVVFGFFKLQASFLGYFLTVSREITILICFLLSFVSSFTDSSALVYALIAILVISHLTNLLTLMITWAV